MRWLPRQIGKPLPIVPTAARVMGLHGPGRCICFCRGLSSQPVEACYGAFRIDMVKKKHVRALFRRLQAEP